MIPSDIVINVDDDDLEEGSHSSIKRRILNTNNNNKQSKVTTVIPNDDEPKPSTSNSESEDNNPQNPQPIANKLNGDNVLVALDDLDKQLTQDQILLFQEFVRIRSLTKVATNEIAVGSNIINIPSGIPDGSLHPPPPYASHENSRRLYVQQSTSYSGPAPSYSEMYVTFTSQKMRNQFVRKVYFILTTQLLFTFGFVSLTVFNHSVKYFVLTTPVLPFLSVITLVTLLILLSCSVPIRRYYPLNAVLLSILTVACTYLMSCIACYYSEKAVLYATGTTAVVCASMMLLAWANFFDVTSWRFFLISAFLIIMSIAVIMTLVYSLIGGSQALSIIVGLLVVVIFSLYLLYDTQKLLGGGRIALSEEEYILGALSLYVDIMLIFNYMLLLFIRR